MDFIEAIATIVVLGFVAIIWVLSLDLDQLTEVFVNCLVVVFIVALLFLAFYLAKVSL